MRVPALFASAVLVLFACGQPANVLFVGDDEATWVFRSCMNGSDLAVSVSSGGPPVLVDDGGARVEVSQVARRCLLEVEATFPPAFGVELSLARRLSHCLSQRGLEIPPGAISLDGDTDPIGIVLRGIEIPDSAHDEVGDALASCRMVLETG